MSRSANAFCQGLRGAVRDFTDAHALHALAEGVAVDGVAIAEERGRGGIVGEGVHDLLGRPRSAGMRGNVEVEDAPAIVSEHDEDEQDAQVRGRNGEEIEGDQIRDVIGKERAPGLRGRCAALRDEPGDGALGHVEAELQQLTMDSRGAPDFLWFMSSDFFLRLPQLLPRHRREMVLVVIRCWALQHDEDDLQPLCAQRRKRLAMRMSPRRLVVVVCPGPFTRTEREERDMIDHVPQAKRNCTTRCLPLRFVRGTAPACAWRCRNDSHRSGASPRRAQSVGAVMPWSPIGSVRTHCAVGMLAKKSSMASRYSPTAATTAASSATRVRINRALGGTTWAGTGSCGCWRTSQSARVRVSLR